MISPVNFPTNSAVNSLFSQSIQLIYKRFSMLIRSFFILFWMPKNQSPSFDCLKAYGRQDIDPINDPSLLKHVRNIHYVHGFNSIYRDKSTILTPIQSISKKPFKIFINFHPRYIHLYDRSSENRYEVGLFEPVGKDKNSSMCDQKIPKSKLIIMIESRFKNIFLLHACKIYSGDDQKMLIEKTTILWIEGYSGAQRIEDEFLLYFDLKESAVSLDIPEFYSEMICECGQIPYFLSNCTEPDLLKEYIVTNIDETLAVVFGLFALALFLALISCCYMKSEAIKSCFNNNSN